MLYNRDLSWLGFNYRVLQEAACPSVPIFERFKFLSIFSSNLDEFFRVRYPSILAISLLKKKTQKKIEGEYIENLAEKVQTEIERQLHEYGDILTQQLVPALEEKGIVLYYHQKINSEHLQEVMEIFLSKVLAFIQPVFLDSTPSEQFFPQNNELYFLVVLKREGQKELMHSVVNIPADKLPRFFSLSPLEGKRYIIFIDDIIRQNMQCIFPGFQISGVYSIKFNRDAELDIQENVEEDILKKIEKQLSKRATGTPSRFLYEEDMPKNIQLFLANSFNIRFEEMYMGGRYHNLKDFAKLPISDPSLSFEPWPPITSSVLLRDCGNIFQAVEERDILLHLPYDSYNPVLSFFNQAAIDPDVAEIYITLYRVAADSHIVNALISAARNGKKVTAFVELKARFDEENNIRWSRQMKEAGVRIIYSLPEIKVHSKTAIVVKRNGSEKKMYAIISTGNFNETTARFYTDHTLITVEPEINREIQAMFQYLDRSREKSRNPSFKTILVSHFNMVDRFEKLIRREIDNAEKGLPARIRVKVNNLEEPQMIQLLYEASKAGVKVDLIVRGICCLVPGALGLSEHITVKRIVDRYLEHSRLFMFGQGEKLNILMGSADWMIRNLRHRIELVTPILDPTCKQQLADYFDLQWQDNDKAVTLSPQMEQLKATASGKVHNAQAALYLHLQNRP